MPGSVLAPVRLLLLASVALLPALAAAQSTQPSVSPTVIDFGNVGVGTTSQGEPVTLFNESGGDALHVTGGVLSGPNASQFSLDPAIGTHTVDAADNIILTLVRYAPTATGAHTATLTIQTDMGNVTVALSGTGVVAKIEVTPRDLQPFGDVPVGFTSTAQSLTIANNGLNGLTLNSVSLGGANPGSFALDPTPTPGTLAAGEELSFDVTCTPLNAGDLLAKVVIDSDDPGTPIIEVTLSCTGTVLGVTTTPGSLDFGNVRVNDSGSASVTIHNGGSATFTIDGPTYVPSTVDVFSLASPTMPIVGVAPGNSVVVTFSFNPTDEALSQAVAFLTIDDGSQVRDLQIPLRGRGVQPHASVMPASLNFGDQRTGTQGQRTVVVANTGGTTLTVSELTAIAAPFSLLGAPSLPLTLEPNGAVTLNVAFTPDVAGAADGTLTITTDDPDRNSIDVTLAGNGIAPALLITPALQLEFGNQRRMTESDPQTLTLVNTGTDVLNISAITLAGPGKDAFVVDAPDAPTTLVNGVPQTITVTFAPAAVDDFTATLTIDSDDADLPHAAVTLTGSGVAPLLLVTPGEDYAFPDTSVGKSSQAVNFTLANGDVAPLPLGEVKLREPTQDFVLDTGDVAGTLPVGQQVGFSVTFTPTATGARQATLDVMLSDDTTPAATIVVHGVGAGAPGGSGCSVAAGGAGPGALVLLVLLTAALRPRRSRRS